MNKDIVKHKDVVRRLNLNLLHHRSKHVSKFTGTNVLIAGGYCSDLYHGIEPKDCDVWVECDLKQYHDNSELLTREVTHALHSTGLVGEFKFHYVNYVRARELDGEEHHDDVGIMENGYLKTVVVQVSSEKNGVDMDMDFIFLDNEHFEDDDIGAFSGNIIHNFDMDITRMYLDDYDNYEEIKMSFSADNAVRTNTVQVFADRDNSFFGKNNSDRVRGGRIERYMMKYKSFNYQYKIVE